MKEKERRKVNEGKGNSFFFLENHGNSYPFTVFGYLKKSIEERGLDIPSICLNVLKIK